MLCELEETTFTNLKFLDDNKVANLSGEQRQMIAIAWAMTRQVRLIIIDEPTILLSYPYQQKLLSLIQAWPQQTKHAHAKPQSMP